MLAVFSLYGYEERRAGFFHFVYTKGNEETARFLINRSRGIMEKIMTDTGRFEPDRPIKVVLTPDPSVIRAEGLRVPEGPDWSAGYAVSSGPLIVIKTRPRGAGGKDPLTLFKHELAHILLDLRCGDHRGGIPTWFSEGFAMYQAMEWRFHDTYTLARAAITTGAIPISDLEKGFPRDGRRAHVAYIESFSFFLFIVDENGAEAIRSIIDSIATGVPFREAFERATGRDLKKVEKRWLKRFRTRYKIIPIVTSSITLWMVITLLVLTAYGAKKRRSQRILERWEEEEATRRGPPYVM